MVFFYRRFLPLDVCIYAFGAENVASSSNLTIPFIKQREAISNFAFETASFILKGVYNRKNRVCRKLLGERSCGVYSSVGGDEGDYLVAVCGDLKGL